MHANLIALLMTLEFLLCLSVAWTIGGGVIKQREALIRLKEAELNIQWPVENGNP